jgi:small subunit ribosomal protein S6
MREYELIFIVHPDLDENAFNDVITKVSSWITEEGGEIAKTDLWGKRKLAYPIRKQTEGQYVFMHTTLSPTFGAQLERNLRFLEPIMRFSLVAK